jgi:hypothetical protein
MPRYSLGLRKNYILKHSLSIVIRFNNVMCIKNRCKLDGEYY